MEYFCLWSYLRVFESLGAMTEEQKTREIDRLNFLAGRLEEDIAYLKNKLAKAIERNNSLESKLQAAESEIEKLKNELKKANDLLDRWENDTY